MKQTLFTLLLITTIGLLSCRKLGNSPDIKQYDQSQIQNYIAANSITGMQRDTSDGDTSGIYYKILAQGRGDTLQYSDEIMFVFTLRSFDGKYSSTDTVNTNHFDGYLGHVSGGGLPKGLQIAIHNILKYKGTAARLLIPSRLAYGIGGYGSGSSTTVNSRIAGNQCLDYYVNVISNQQVYDDYLINSYITTNKLGVYNKTPDGVYYKVLIPGTGQDNMVEYSTFSATYVGKLLNDVVFDSTAETTAATFTLNTLVAGVQKSLIGQAAGASVSVLIPSRWGYGRTGNTTGGVTIGTNVCLHFEWQIQTVTNP